MVSLVLWSAWMAAEFWSPLPPLYSWTSELGATNQPWGWVVRLCDVLAGAVMLRWVVLMVDDHPVRRDLRSAGVVAAGVFGVATMADAMLPMSCASSVDAACLAAEKAGDLPWWHYGHSVTSTLAGSGLLVASGALSVSMRRRYPGGGAVLLSLFALIAVTLVWQLVSLLPAGSEPWLLTVPGLAQRAQLVCTLAWWVTFGLLVHPLTTRWWRTRQARNHQWALGEH